MLIDEAVGTGEATHGYAVCSRAGSMIVKRLCPEIWSSTESCQS